MDEPTMFTAVLMDGRHGSTMPQSFPLPEDGEVPEQLVVQHSDDSSSVYQREGTFDGTAWPYGLVEMRPASS
jgi:hypothetical protein